MTIPWGKLARWMALSSILGAATTFAANYTVTTVNDSGGGSLRQAILNAEGNNGKDTIKFNIAGSPPFVIHLVSALPQIKQAVIIDGTTQPGYAGQPLVMIDGSALTGSKHGLDIRAGGSTVQGLVISGFPDSGIYLDQGDGNIIDLNFIGTDANGTLPLGNLIGLEILSDNNTVGKTAGNLISGNRGVGVQIEGNGNKLQDTWIGTDITGTNALPNASDGVAVGAGAQSNTIGNASATLGNVIAFNGGAGVLLLTTNKANAVLSNSIYTNDFLGIDRGTTNGAPFLSSASTAGSNTTVIGTLSDRPSMTYQVQLFSNTACDSSGLGEGENFITNIVVTTGSAGRTNFTAVLSSAISTGLFMTATATDPANNTSEFSPCVLVLAPDAIAGDLRVSQTATPSPASYGSNFVYTVTVINAGPATANGVTMIDPLPAGALYQTVSSTHGSCFDSGGTVYCNLGLLATNAPAIVTITVFANRTGNFTNTASVAGADIDPILVNNVDTIVVSVPPTVDLAVSQIPSASTINVGSIITYSFTIRNNGPSPATTVRLTDVLPAILSYGSVSASQGSVSHSGNSVTANLGTLSAGGEATVTIVASGATAGTATNTANVTSTEAEFAPANNSASVVTTVDPTCDLKLTLSASPSSVYAGQDITYTLKATNQGPSPSTGVTVVDPLPTGVSFVSATTTQGTVTNIAGTVTGNLGALASGANATITIVGRTSVSAVGNATNTATVAAAEYDPVSGNNSAFDKTTVNPRADLGISLSANLGSICISNNITYSITVTNTGPSTATAVTVQASRPGALIYVSGTASQGSCTPSGDKVNCSLGNLAVGGSATVSLEFTAKSAGTLNYNVSVSANENDPVSANDSATVPTTINDTSDLGISQFITPNPPIYGSNTTYTITVANNGPSKANGIIVSNALPVSVTFVSVSSSEASCTNIGSLVVCTLNKLEKNAIATIRLVLNTDAAGSYTNVATVSGQECDIAPSNNITGPSVVTTELTLELNGGPNPVNLGSNLTYSISVTNSGPEAATNVTLTDPLPAGVTFVSASASLGTCTNIGGTVICNIGVMPIGYKATASLIVRTTAAGSLTNTATVSTSDFDPVLGDNTASAVVNVLDPIPPTITAPADVTVSTDVGQCTAASVVLGTPVTTDNDAVASLINNAPATFPKGLTTVTWTATDSSGNTATATQRVTVNDTELPEITAPADVMVNANPGKTFASGVALGSPVTSDNCGVASVVQDAPNRIPVGTNTITWTVTDTSGNHNTALQTVIVEGPSQDPCDLTGNWVATKYGCRTRGSAAGRCYILGYFEVVNAGTTPAAPCQVNFYRSVDPVFDGGDVLIKSKRLKKLTPGKSARLLFGSDCASGDIPTGEYLIAVIDADNAVVETSETNNVVVDAPLQ